MSLPRKLSDARTANLFAAALIFIFSVIMITICSKSSPLYPMNNWDDANCFFTVGKAVGNGEVMYRDIFEQKGPVLYFLHTIAYFISRDSFLGVYFIEIAACFGFLFVSYKITELFEGRKSILFIPILGALIYSSKAFEQGDSVEELCLPLFTLSLYIGVKAVMNKKTPDKLGWFIIGVCSAAVLWIKFSMLGFYIGFGFFMLFLYLREKKFSQLFKSIGFLLLGIAAMTAPVAIYFIVTGAFRELFEVYFYDNLFLYSISDESGSALSFVGNLGWGYLSFREFFDIAFWLIIAGAVYAFIASKRLLGFYITTVLSTFFFAFSGGRTYPYYSLLMAVFTPFGAALVCRILKKPLSHIRKTALRAVTVSASFAVSLAIILSLSPNTYMMKYKKDDLPQYKFAAIASESDNPTLLNYDFLDGGFYTASGIVPNCRFFCGLNLPYDEIKSTQKRFIREKKTEYIVTIDKKFSFDGYDCVGKEVFETRKDCYSTYYFYKLRASSR